MHWRVLGVSLELQGPLRAARPPPPLRLSRAPWHRFERRAGARALPHVPRGTCSAAAAAAVWHENTRARSCVLI